MVPRSSEESNSTWPFDIQASDVDVLVELKPQGKVPVRLIIEFIDLIMI